MKHSIVAMTYGDSDVLSLVEEESIAPAESEVIVDVKGIGTVSDGQHDRLREFGAEPVIYGDGLVDRVRALALNGVDAAIDCIGTDEAIDTSLELVSNPSLVVSIAAFARGADGITLLGGGPNSDPGTEIRRAARLQLVELANEGTLTVDVERTFALSEAAKAQDLVSNGHAHGKVILIP